MSKVSTFGEFNVSESIYIKGMAKAKLQELKAERQRRIIGRDLIGTRMYYGILVKADLGRAMKRIDRKFKLGISC